MIRPSKIRLTNDMMNDNQRTLNYARAHYCVYGRDE